MSLVSQVTLVSVQESGDGIPLIRDSGHEIRDYEIFDGGGRPARSDDFRKDAERHELGRERPASAIRASRELLTSRLLLDGLELAVRQFKRFFGRDTTPLVR